MALRWARCGSGLPTLCRGRCKGSMASPERPLGSISSESLDPKRLHEWSFRVPGCFMDIYMHLLIQFTADMCRSKIAMSTGSNVHASQGYEDWTWVTSSWPHAHDRAVSGKVLPGMVLLSTPLSKTLLESLWNRTSVGIHRPPRLLAVTDFDLTPKLGLYDSVYSAERIFF